MSDINEDFSIEELNRINELKGFISGHYKLSFWQKVYRIIKTIIDFIIGLLGIIIASPIMILTAIAIKIDSRGPILFKQTRIGFNNKDFTCYKFRSMSTEAKHDVASYEYEGVNSYITRVGKFIRKTSIDELPQLFNLINGTMSIIGYRPSQRNEKILNDAREYYNVYQVKPGITGWAQINGRDILASTPKKKAKYDAYYVQKFSLLFDLKIFFLTFIKVIKKENVEEGKIEKRK